MPKVPFLHLLCSMGQAGSFLFGFKNVEPELIPRGFALLVTDADIGLQFG